MSFLRTIKAAGGTVALALAVGVVFAACNEDREDVTSPVGDFVFNFLVDQSLRTGIPSGSAEVPDFAIAEADTSGGDFYEFANAPLDDFVSIDTDFGPGMAFDLGPAVRNGSQDPRLPDLTDDDAEVDGFWGLFNPAWTGVGPGWWDLFGGIQGLDPETTYTIALARMAVQVNGVLDQVAPLFNLSDDPPDELVFLGGSESGAHDVVCDFSAGVGVTADRNPVALGTITTDDSGAQTVDCLPVAFDNSPWWRSTSAQTPSGAADSLPFGEDQLGVGLEPGQYNYVLIIEGQGTDANPVPDVAPAVRVQMGPDIDTNGNPLPHGLAPYPALNRGEILDQYSDKAAGRAGGIQIGFENLARLSGGVYQVWLVNVETGDMVSPTGNWTATMDGEVVGSQDGVKSFNSEAGWSHTFVTNDELAGTAVGEFTHAFVSIESTEASSPSARQPFWFQYTDMGGAPDDPFEWSFNSSGSVSFGTFNGGDDPVPFVARGQGRAGFWGDDRGSTNVLRARFRNLQIPPRGYFYGGWLATNDGQTVDLGPITTEFEEGFQSLKDVDQDPSISTNVAPAANLIVVSAQRATADELGISFPNFDTYEITLAPKMGAASMPPSTVLGSAVPEPVTDRRPDEGDGGDGGGGS